MDGSCEVHYSTMEKHLSLKIKEKRYWRKWHNSLAVTSKMEVKGKWSTELGMYFPYQR